MFLINIRPKKWVIKLLENSGRLKSVPDCYKNQVICNEAVDNCTHALLEFDFNYYKTQKNG